LICENFNQWLGACTDKPIESIFSYLFSENGLMAFGDGKSIGETSMIDEIGDDYYQELTNEIFGLMSKIKLPVKRGTFIEFRKGMINVSPIGRQCSQTERDSFEIYDKTANVRPTMVKESVKNSR
jgi:phosphomannomutase